MAGGHRTPAKGVGPSPGVLVSCAAGASRRPVARGSGTMRGWDGSMQVVALGGPNARPTARRCPKSLPPPIYTNEAWDSIPHGEHVSAAAATGRSLGFAGSKSHGACHRWFTSTSSPFRQCVFTLVLFLSVCQNCFLLVACGKPLMKGALQARVAG